MPVFGAELASGTAALTTGGQSGFGCGCGCGAIGKVWAGLAWDTGPTAKAGPAAAAVTASAAAATATAVRIFEWDMRYLRGRVVGPT
ncbi:hypothetical protein L1080_025955 [Rhodococcus sp. MSC1_016]